ncbi:MAG TPA: hypothetical protein VGM08_02960 [Candidatus Saccharimonadales bacterium]|jgi:hypothetical protein
MKLMISLGLLIFSSLGGWLGSMLDHSGIGGWSILLTAVGGFFGIWVGYKAGKYFF